MGAKVITAQDVRLTQHPDENHAAYALRNGYILLTCDRNYLDDQRFPLIHCPAIAVFDFGSGSDEEIKQAFICLWRALRAPQFYNKWTKIDAKRDSWTELSRHLDGTTSRARCRVHRGQFQEWSNPEGSMKLRVECYAGGKADERPVRFWLNEREYSVEEVIDQWYGPDHIFFKVRANDANLYILRRCTSDPEWEWDLVSFRQTRSE